MQSNHFFSEPNHLVLTALHSLTVTNPSVAFDPENKIVFRRPDASSSNVSVISGGGSGHEPAFAGYVGKGLLTASVAGTIFASPSAGQVRKAVMECVNTDKGVLILIVNYTGDVLNFGMAAEMAKSAGIPIEFLAIGDDVGVGRKKVGKVGRRGIGGSVLVLKIAGALAELGASLEDVYRIARLTATNLVSLGSSLDRVHIPGHEFSKLNPGESVPADEVEVGMGIHNEPGSHRMKSTTPEELIRTMLLQLLDLTDQDRAYITREAEDSFVLLINNLGGLSTLELCGITNEVFIQLGRDYNITPVRIIQGTFLSSLNGLGFSISLLKLADTGLAPGGSMLELLDAPAEAVGWAAPIRTSTWVNSSDIPVVLKKTKMAEEQPSNLKVDSALLKKTVSAGLKRLIDAEPLVTRFDTILGDGDCGVGLKRGAEAVLKLLEQTNPPDDIVVVVSKIASVVENNMDGTSGAIYSIFLNSLVQGLRQQDTGSTSVVTSQKWAAALKYSLSALGKYTPAQIGDRTLLDTLAPFCMVLMETHNVQAAIKAAREGTEATKYMKASLGRSVYVGGEEEWLGKVPDPGAYGLYEFLAGLAEAI